MVGAAKNQINREVDLVKDLPKTFKDRNGTPIFARDILVITRGPGDKIVGRVVERDGELSVEIQYVDEKFVHSLTEFPADNIEVRRPMRW